MVIYYDSESGLWYNLNRYYDPITGRYLQGDPIGLAGGLNTYACAENNPLSLIDPLGLCAQEGSETKNGLIARFLIDHGYGSLSLKGGFIVVGAFDLIITAEGISTYLGAGLGVGVSATATIGVYAGPDSTGFNIKNSVSGGGGVGANASYRVSDTRGNAISRGWHRARRIYE